MFRDLGRGTLAAIHIVATRDRSGRVMQAVLAKGAAIDMRTGPVNGFTALIKAAECGQGAAVRVLLGAGADWTLTDAHGETALAWAKKPVDDDQFLSQLPEEELREIRKGRAEIVAVLEATAEAARVKAARVAQRYALALLAALVSRERAKALAACTPGDEDVAEAALLSDAKADVADTAARFAIGGRCPIELWRTIVSCL